MTEAGPISLVVLTTRAPVSYGLIESLAWKHNIKGVVFEDQKRLRARLLAKRLRARGIVEVFDQILFKVFSLLFLSTRAGCRVNSTRSSCRPFDGSRFPQTEVVETTSVNSADVLRLILRTEPDVVVVSGTSILDAILLSSLKSIPVINIHCGITPRYRGAHGAFWAIVNDDWDNIGVTVHFVDSGIDTGNIIAQGNILVEPKDTPRDLALRQHAMGVTLAAKAIEYVASGQIQTISRDDLDSRFHSSPTLSGYAKFRKNMRAHFRSIKSQQ